VRIKAKKKTKNSKSKIKKLEKEVKLRKIRKFSFLGILGVVIAVLFLISISSTQAQVQITKGKPEGNQRSRPVNQISHLQNQKPPGQFLSRQ